jgi:plastocyanin
MQRQLFLLALAVVCSFSNAQISVSSSSSSAAGGASSGPGTSVAGRIKFDGPLPTTLPIAMRSDPACASEHPQPARSQEMVPGQNGTLENVVVFVSQGADSRTYEVPPTPVVMEQKGCMYEPHVLAMRAGQTLRVVNADKTTHNIHPMPANNREWNKAQIPGQPIEEKFAREEVSIPVKCNIHPWMHSYIAVFKHPYFAVTGKDGSFELKNLPPGEYTIEAWHEKLGTMTQHVKIAQGENKKVDFTFKPRG